MSKRKAAMALAAAVGLGSAGQAHAWMQFCNATSATIWTAHSTYDSSCVPVDGSTWRNVGWWGLTPGQCKIVYGNAIPGSYIYFYAEGGGRYWGGEFVSCTPYAAFNLCDHSCTGNSRNLGYRQRNTGGAANYTVTFTL
ncbi:DUF1036 domain-containing protein [Corallococcus terminator]